MMTSKRILAWVLAILFCLPACIAAADGDPWYCPTCGRLNDGNYCPVDATARPASGGGLKTFSDYYPGVTAKIRKLSSEKDRHQSYAGPGANYSTAGAYKPYKVRRVEAFFEENNFIFVHLTYQTVDDRYLYFRKSNFSSLPNVPHISELEYRTAVTTGVVDPSWGPSKGYALESEFTAAKGTKLKVFFRQNGFVYAEYQCGRGLVRMWLPEDRISWT